MSKRYTAGVVSSTSPTVNAAGASGVFTLNQQSAAQSTNNWPPYKVEKSLRFRSSASGYLSRTPGSAGNRKIWTYSCWAKMGSGTGNWSLLSCPAAANDNQYLTLYWNQGSSTGKLYFGVYTTNYRISTPLYRDPSGWYHFVFVLDTTQATANNRIRIYVNGVEVTAFSTLTNPTQNADLGINQASATYIGTENASVNYLDGYLAEVNLIDGQALTPSSFGGTDKDGNWSPIAYTGSYGTNGFYLNFKDVTSAATTGYDYSGNGNNWTLSGFNVSTANTSYDSMIDVPEDQSDGTANNRGSYCTFNPLDKDSDITVSNGNLSASTSTVAHNLIRSTIAIPSSGKWYAEMSFDQTMNGNPAAAFALISPSASLSAHIVSAGNYAVYGSSLTTLNSGATSGASVTGMASGQTWQIAVDADNNQAWVGLNNAWYNVYTSGATTGNPSTNTNPTFTGTMAGLFFGADFVNSSGSINFGQRPFAYAPPTGFKALNTNNLPEPTIKQPNKYFDVKLWTGNDVSPRQVVSGLSFQPDFAWTKTRSISTQHALYDAVRGAGSGKILLSDQTVAEGGTGGTSDATYGYLSAFNSDGFTTTKGSDSTNYFFNNGNYPSGAQTYVSWLWNAGGSTVTNTSGTISAQVRSNPTAGFSIVTYTGNGISGATVGHGLGATPSMIIVKRRDAGSSGWSVYFTTLSAGNILALQSTNGQASSPARFTTTLPTSSVFSIGTDSDLNASGGTYVAYCFAPVAGYSAFGSYTGNGSTDGPFVYTGFRPAYVITKKSNNTGNWYIWDNKRIIQANGDAGLLYAETSLSESDYNAAGIDFLSNGFKIRNSDSSDNGSGDTIIYAAFAETPFKYARAR